MMTYDQAADEVVMIVIAVVVVCYVLALGGWIADAIAARAERRRAAMEDAEAMAARASRQARARVTHRGAAEDIQ